VTFWEYAFSSMNHTNVSIFWDITPCYLYVNRRFVRMCRLNLQVENHPSKESAGSRWLGLRTDCTGICPRRGQNSWLLLWEPQILHRITHSLAVFSTVAKTPRSGGALCHYAMCFKTVSLSKKYCMTFELHARGSTMLQAEGCDFVSPCHWIFQST
jgi:hypothetical protein